MGSNSDSFYVTLFSNSSTKVIPDNTIASFIVQLAHEIDLRTDRWEVAICEFSCPPPCVGNIKLHVVLGDTNALIYCDLITPRFVNQLNVRCLRTFIHTTASCNQVFENLYYIWVEKQKFRDITMQVFDIVGNPIALKISMTPRRSFYISDAFDAQCI